MLVIAANRVDVVVLVVSASDIRADGRAIIGKLIVFSRFKGSLLIVMIGYCIVAAHGT